MQELEKILKEIKEVLEENKVIELNGDCTVDRCIIDVALAWDSIKAIIHNHMNDGWIPVEERLPEEAGTYIINALTGERNIVTFAKWQNRYKRFDMTGARTYWKIIAWCPLPEPYKPERSNDNSGKGSGAMEQEGRQ